MGMIPVHLPRVVSRLEGISDNQRRFQFPAPVGGGA